MNDELMWSNSNSPVLGQAITKIQPISGCFVEPSFFILINDSTL